MTEQTKKINLLYSSTIYVFGGRVFTLATITKKLGEELSRVKVGR